MKRKLEDILFVLALWVFLAGLAFWCAIGLMGAIDYVEGHYTAQVFGLVWLVAAVVVFFVGRGMR